MTSDMIRTIVNNTFSAEDLEKKLTEIVNGPLDSQDFVIQTGERGAEIFHLAMKRESLRFRLKYVADKGIITPFELIRLNEMIDSDDPGNMVVVETIIDAKLNVIK